MKKMITLLLIILLTNLFSTNLSAQHINDKENLDFYEVVPFNEQLTIEEKNRSLGLVSDYDILNDKSLWTFSLHLNTDIAGIADLMSFQANYIRNLDYFWVNGFISKTNATFETISHQNYSIEEIKKSTDESLLTVGLGIGYRFFWIQHLLESIIDTRDIYEFTTASLTYQTLDEDVTSDSFKGWGLQTEFTIAKRLSPRYHVGLKTSYNLATVKRKVEEGSSSSANSLVVSWLSLALELGLYF